jgi:hypothetical protein
MSKLEKKLIDYLNLKLLKQDYVHVQKWDLASNVRENERILVREFHNILTSSSDYEYDWEVYDKSVKYYCEQRFNTTDAKSILKTLNREEKLKQLGI